jgi:hypothetical protein
MGSKRAGPNIEESDSDSTSDSDSDSKSAKDEQSSSEDSGNGGPALKKNRKHCPPPIIIEDIKEPSLSYNDEDVDMAMQNHLQKHQFLLPESVDAWTNSSTAGGYRFCVCFT